MPCFERPLTLRHLPATRTLNSAIPVCALCITRRLYKVVTLKVVVITNSEKRRAIIEDLLIGVGVPILQIIARECAQPFVSADYLLGCKSDYIVSTNRYDIYEDFGPYNPTATTPPTSILFTAWPVTIGIVAAFYFGEYPAYLRSLAPWLICSSHGHLHALQART
jgi:pheromone a factor receptor